MTTWPFKNEIVSVELTGKQLMENLLCCGGAVAGLTYRRTGDHVMVTLKNGRALDPGATYRIPVNSYMYAGGDNYLFKTQNPDGYNLGVQMEEPVIKWIQSQMTSPQQYFAAQTMQADVTHRIGLRYLEGVIPKMRVKHGTRIFDILSIINVGERNRRLILLINRCADSSAVEHSRRGDLR